jgi:GNAT superfamily N-acetyltransferase
MKLDLDAEPRSYPAPPDLRLDFLDDREPVDTDDVPYYDEEIRMTRRMLSLVRPQRAWHFGAWSEGGLVGHGTLHVTTGRLGVAGVYDVGVSSSFRRRGIGTAITTAACTFARSLGYKTAMLNATPMGERVYERIGFQSVGHGLGWWLSTERLESLNFNRIG